MRGSVQFRIIDPHRRHPRRRVAAGTAIAPALVIDLVVQRVAARLTRVKTRVVNSQSPNIPPRTLERRGSDPLQPDPGPHIEFLR